MAAVEISLIKKINTSLVKSIHKDEIDEIASNLNISETEAILSLKALRLGGQRISKIENLELFDQTEELYLHNNIIEKIEVIKTTLYTSVKITI